MPRSSIKDVKTYRKLRKMGESKQKAARISNAAAAEGKSKVGRRGGKGAVTTTGPRRTWRRRPGTSGSRAGRR